MHLRNNNSIKKKHNIIVWYNTFHYWYFHVFISGWKGETPRDDQEHNSPGEGGRDRDPRGKN